MLYKNVVAINKKGERISWDEAIVSRCWSDKYFVNIYDKNGGYIDYLPLDEWEVTATKEICFNEI